MASRCWAILTGEYPPMPGGVADHTQILAKALVAAGDEVHVFVPGEYAIDCFSAQPPFVRPLPDHYGPPGLAQLSRWVESLPSGARLLVQYTPQAFGWRGMNVPLGLWLRRIARSRPVDVLFHEVHAPIGPNQPLRHNLVGGVTRWMARQVAQSAQRIFVSTSSWESILRPMVADDVPIRLTAVPSNLPTDPPPACVAATRLKITRCHDGMLVVGLRDVRSVVQAIARRGASPPAA